MLELNKLYNEAKKLCEKKYSYRLNFGVYNTPRD